MGALISEFEATSFLGLEPGAFYELACKHKLPVVNVAGKLFVEARDLARWREALASEQASGRRA